MQIVLTTLPDADAAGKLARQLVEAGLAACVSVLAPWIARKELDERSLVTLHDVVAAGAHGARHTPSHAAVSSPSSSR